MRTNFHDSVKLHEACAPYNVRPAMQCVFFENGYAYASDEHIAVRCEISRISSFCDESMALLEGKMLHKDSYRRILEYDFARIMEDGIECSNDIDGSIVFFPFFRLDVKFLNVEKVIQESVEKEIDKIEKFTICGSRLSRLLSALGESDRYLFSHKGTNDVIVVRGKDFPGNVGVILPFICDE